MAAHRPWEYINDVNNTNPMIDATFHTFEAFVNAMALQRFFFVEPFCETTLTWPLVGEHVQLKNSELKDAPQPNFQSEYLV